MLIVVLIVVKRHRQFAQTLQGADGSTIKRGQPFQHGVLLRLEWIARRESIFHRHRLARLVLLRQQQFGQRAPARQFPGVRHQSLCPVAQQTATQIIRSKARQRHPLALPCVVQHIGDQCQFLADHVIKCLADRRLGVVEARNLPPLFAPRQHVGKQSGQPRHIVIEMRQRNGHGIGMLAFIVTLAFKMIQRPPCGFFVMPPRLFCHRRLRAEA